MMRGHRGLLGVVAMLAAFGLQPLPPPPEPEIDLAEVAKVLDLLTAAGIASPDVLEAAGSPARFIATARKCLAAQAFLASFGEPGITDVGRLLAPRSGAGVADMHRDRDEARRGATAADIESDKAYLARARASVQPKATTGAAGQVTEEQARRDPDAFARYVMSDHHPAMTYRERGPVDFKRAGEESRARRVVHHVTAEDVEADKVFLAQVQASRLGPLPRRMTIEDVHGVGQAGYLEVGPDGWRSSPVVIKRSKRPAKSREIRNEQAADRKARARRKARRGW